jgi:uncharacterized membrane protein
MLNNPQSVVRRHKIALLSLALVGSAVETTNVVTALVTLCIALVLLTFLFEERIINELHCVEDIRRNEANND